MTGSFVFAILLASGMEKFLFIREGLLLLALLFIGNGETEAGMDSGWEGCQKAV